MAVGLDEPRGGTPSDKDRKIRSVYPWGTAWPPPLGAGNYYPSLKVDEFASTSPVGSFAVNKFGLFDMGGNVWQWCEDFYNGSFGAPVTRGGAFDVGSPDYLLSSVRYDHVAIARYGIIGFRVVVVVSPPSP